MSVDLIIISIVIILFSVIIHEISHGWVADLMGDPTARSKGRLSLNPIKHIDILGTILLPILLAVVGAPVIGWAKPVPVNYYNLKHGRWGELLVSAAGILSNLFLAVVFGLLLRFYVPLQLNKAIIDIFQTVVFVNLSLATFNLLPIPPLDGSKIWFAFWPQAGLKMDMFFAKYGLFIFIFLIFFIEEIGRYVLWPVIQFIYTIIVG